MARSDSTDQDDKTKVTLTKFVPFSIVLEVKVAPPPTPSAALAVNLVHRCNVPVEFLSLIYQSGVHLAKPGMPRVCFRCICTRKFGYSVRVWPAHPGSSTATGLAKEAASAHAGAPMVKSHTGSVL